MKNTYTSNASAEGFITVPKSLIYGGENGGISPYACLLYGLMLDRSRLSEKNGWNDENGKTFLFFRIREICEIFKCGKNKAESLIRELCLNGLIKKKKTGQGRPAKYYIVYNEVYPYEENKCSRNWNSGVPETGIQEVSKQESNNNYMNNNYDSNNYFFICEGEDDIRELIDYDLLILNEDKEDVDSIVGIIYETVVSKQKDIRIGSEIYPHAEVAKRLLELEYEHISYVLETLYSCKSEIRDIRAYTLKLLFYAPSTMSLYYSAMFNRNMNNEEMKE